MKFWVLFSLVVGIAAACSSAPPRETNPGAIQPLPSPVEVPPASINRSKQWHIKPVMASQRYQITSTTKLELTGLSDSITSVAVITLNTQPTDTAIIFSGTVDTTALRAGSRIGATQTLPRLPIAFAGVLSPGLVRTTSPSACASTAVSPTAFIPRIVTAFPNTVLTPGLTWSDSVTFSSCNGEIPTLTTVIQSFRIVGEDTTRGLPAIVISRTDRFTGSGNGSQDQHRVELSSSGTGSGQLWVTADTGRLLQAISESSGTVIVRASGRQQTFNQTITERIESR